MITFIHPPVPRLKPAHADFLCPQSNVFTKDSCSLFKEWSVKVKE